MIKVFKDDRTKTVSVVVNYVYPKKEEDIPANYMLPEILSKTTMKHKNLKEITKQLYKLYDTTLDVDTSEIGDLTIVSYTLQMINPKYLNETKELFYEGLELLSNLIYEPYISEENFLLRKLQELKNIDIFYAEENMADIIICQMLNLYSVIGMTVVDKIMELSELTLAQLLEYHNRIINDGQTIVQIIGNVEDYMVESVKEKISLTDSKFKYNYKLMVPLPLNVEKDVFSGTSTILKFGLEFSEAKESEKDVYKICNYILGEITSSRMFRVIREKYNLAYNVYSIMDIYKSSQIVGSVIIEYKNTNKTIKLFKELLKQEVTKEEFEVAKKLLMSALKLNLDNEEIVASYDLYSTLAGTNETAFERLKKLEYITYEDVKRAYKKLRLTSIFIYGGK